MASQPRNQTRLCISETRIETQVELVSLAHIPCFLGKANKTVPNSSVSLGHLDRPARTEHKSKIKQHSKIADVISPAYISRIYRYDVSFLPRFGLLISSLLRPSSTAKTKRSFHYKIKTQ